MKLRLSLLLLLWWTLAPVAAPAQTGLGQLQGTVRDSAGAAVPGAALSLEHLATGSRSETVTSEDGVYVFPSLRPGGYRLTARSAGMEAWQADLTLQVGQQGQIDPVLKVASLTAQVTVAGDLTPLVATNSPTMANVLERARVEQLPLNGRFLQDLVTLTTPGVEGASNRPRVFGLRDTSMEWLQDGAVVSDRNTGRISERPPGIDTIEEFRVETSVPSAKYSRPASTILSTRSGTNQWHGSLFYTGRNNGFGVARRRQDFFSKPPQLIRNEYGASTGGPVILPKLYDGRNRTFFFAAWEDFRLRSATTISTRMPTAAMRQGDFSGLVDGAGRQIVLYDPLTTNPQTRSRQPFPGNRIPLSRLSPLAKYVFDVTPLPTQPEVNPLVAPNWFGPDPQNQNHSTYTARIDHQFGERDSVFGRVTSGGFDQGRRRGFNTANSPITSDFLWNYEFIRNENTNAAISWTHTFSPTLFVETLFTVSRNLYDFSTSGPGVNEDVAGRLGLPNPFGRTAAPQLSNLGFDSNYHGSLPRLSDSRVISGEQNFTAVRGKHQLEFGWRYRDEEVGVLPDTPFQSTINFNSLATGLYDPSSGTAFNALPRTGNDAANFFLGVAASYTTSIPTGFYHQRGKEVSGYVQDNWKVTPSLTLNLGLRYEYFAPYLDEEGLFSIFDLDTKTIIRRATTEQLIERGETTPSILAAFSAIGVKVRTPEEAGVSLPLVRSNKFDFSPRVGFAYQMRPFGRAVALRGGYGQYHFGMPARTLQSMSNGNPPLRGSLTYSLNAAAQTPDGLPNLGIRSVPTVFAGANTANLLDPNRADTIARGIGVNAFDRELPTSTAHEWNVSLEAEVMRNTLARVGYVGTAGRNLDQYRIINGQPNNYVWFVSTGQPLPTGTFAPVARRPYDQVTYGNINIYGRTGYSNFNGLQVEVQRRFGDGLAFQFFYVLSNAFSTGNLPSEGGDNFVNALSGPEVFLPGAVPQDFDERNRLLVYARDVEIPQHRVRWNMLAELPFGSGKRWLSRAGPVLDRLVGGWQIAAYGSGQSRDWRLPTSNWGTLGEVEIYGTRYKVDDCRSGVCVPGYLYYNGYIPANRINSTDAQGRPNGVMGVPGNYRPAHQPIYPTPANGGSPADPNFSLYETNNVNVRLNNGTTQRVALDTNLHPWRNQFLPAPWAFDMSASLFKEIPVTERLRVRLNMDFFNVLNAPGLTLPDGASGILSLQNSQNAPRQLQWTVRLTW